jgi:hypothetical protein
MGQPWATRSITTCVSLTTPLSTLQAQALPASSSAFAQGRMLSVPRSAASRCTAQRLVTYAAAAPTADRLRLNNLSPQEGSRKKEKRKGRGYGSGQVIVWQMQPALVVFVAGILQRVHACCAAGSFGPPATQRLVVHRRAAAVALACVARSHVQAAAPAQALRVARRRCTGGCLS